MKVIEVEPAATTAAAVVEEAIVVAQIEEVKPAVDATLPVAPNESPAVLAAPEQSDKPAEGNEQLPAVESALPAKEEPTPFQPKPMKLKLTVPSLALTHEQSQRYDQIATSTLPAHLLVLFVLTSPCRRQIKSLGAHAKTLGATRDFGAATRLEFATAQENVRSITLTSSMNVYALPS